jgi:hypothetical protein
MRLGGKRTALSAYLLTQRDVADMGSDDNSSRFMDGSDDASSEAGTSLRT